MARFIDFTPMLIVFLEFDAGLGITLPAQLALLQERADTAYLSDELLRASAGFYSGTQPSFTRDEHLASSTTGGNVKFAVQEMRGWVFL